MVPLVLNHGHVGNTSGVCLQRGEPENGSSPFGVPLKRPVQLLRTAFDSFRSCSQMPKKKHGLGLNTLDRRKSWDFKMLSGTLAKTLGTPWALMPLPWYVFSNVVFYPGLLFLWRAD